MTRPVPVDDVGLLVRVYTEASMLPGHIPGTPPSRAEIVSAALAQVQISQRAPQPPGSPTICGQDGVNRMSKHVPKKKIPNPADVPAQHEGKVLDHVAEQFGLTKTHQGHYGIKAGSVTLGETSLNETTKMNETPVHFIRVDDPAVPAEDHGLDLA